MNNKKLKIIGPYTPKHPGPFCTQDGQTVSAWLYRTQDGSHCVTRYFDEVTSEGVEHWPLYTRAANVAALKARIAELEGALHAQSVWHEAQRKALSKQPQSPYTQWRMAEHYEEIRTALTCEVGKNEETD